MEDPSLISKKSIEGPDMDLIVCQPRKHSRRHKIESLQSITSVFANVAVVLGLAFAAVQIVQFRAHERVRIAVDATDVVYSAQFLSAYTNVIECNRRGAEVPREDLVFVTNAYDSIAILYLRGVADGAIIHSRIGPNVPGLLRILGQEKWPEASTQNLQRMAHELKLTQ